MQPSQQHREAADFSAGRPGWDCSEFSGLSRGAGAGPWGCAAG